MLLVVRATLIALSLLGLGAFSLGASSSALACDVETVEVSVPMAPSAIFVDGVKVGTEIAAMPKNAPQRVGRCSSGRCIVTY